MIAALGILSGDLLPTKTYGLRSWVWVPDDADGRLGNLTIKVSKSARPGCKVEADTYAVQADGDGFLLCNLTDPDQPDVYRAVVGPHASCTCKAGQCKVASGCKHLDSLAAVLAAGGFDRPPADDLPDCFRNLRGPAADAGCPF